MYNVILQFIKQYKAVIILSFLYFIIFSILSSLRHYTFQTQVWDLAAFEHSFWNTLQGNVMYNNFEQTIHFAIHFSPILFVLVPLYALIPSVYTLLIAQSAALAIGAIPLYLLAEKEINKKWALIISVMYLLYPSLHWINMFDFHAVPFAIPLFLFAFYFLSKNKYIATSIFLFLAALVAENIIVAVFFVGVYIFLFKNKKFGAAVTVLSLLYFILVSQVIMPAFGGGIVRLDRYEQFGNSATEIITNVITQPQLTAATVFTTDKIIYLLNLFLSAAFLPLAAWQTIVLLVPGLLQNLLTSFSFQFQSYYQYDSILVAFIFIGIVYGVKKILSKTDKEKMLMTFILVCIVLGFSLNSILSPKNFPLERYTDPRAKDFRKLAALIPEDASVATHTNLVTHLTHREHIYQMGFEPFLVDYVVGDGQDIFGFSDQESFDEYLDVYKQSGGYTLTLIENRYFIIKRK